MKAAGLKIGKIHASGIAACAALGTGAWFALVGPTLAQRDKDDVSRHQLSERHQKAADLNAALAATRRQVEAANASLSQATIKLQPASDLNSRLTKLTDLATRCGLTIDEMRPGVLSDSSRFQTLPVHMAGTGTYPACAKFLHTLRQSYPDTGVESLEAANSNPAPQGSDATFRFDLVWYTKR
ncbi:MAG TPA: type 4a pilus biogenesis protein PilO [Tepidisphaeraceae bacterium]|jgi:Tfp pilus assembly protein PilO|nr:type 4a pilus biogenesis protein PilO [Tepidisphaeraceae bacterium]